MRGQSVLVSNVMIGFRGALTLHSSQAYSKLTRKTFSRTTCIHSGTSVRVFRKGYTTRFGYIALSGRRSVIFLALFRSCDFRSALVLLLSTLFVVGALLLHAVLFLFLALIVLYALLVVPIAVWYYVSASC